AESGSARIDGVEGAQGGVQPGDIRIEGKPAQNALRLRLDTANSRVVTHVEKLGETGARVENTDLVVLVNVIEAVELGAQPLAEEALLPTDLIIGHFLRFEQRWRCACWRRRGRQRIDSSRLVTC